MIMRTEKQLHWNDFGLALDSLWSPYLALTGELWDASREILTEKFLVLCGDS